MTTSVHVKFPGIDLPPLTPGQVRHVVAREGGYIERRTEMYSTSVRTFAPIPSLQPHREQCKLYFPRIPRVLTRVMLAFFHEAYRMHQGEAALILLYHSGRRQFRWFCPVQTVEVYYSFGRPRAYDSITYEIPLTLPEGYLILGDAHSHANFHPAPSGVDHHDESYKDGLHVIVGELGRKALPQYHIDFVMDGQRFAVAPQDIFDDASCEPLDRAPAQWVDRIVMKQRSSWSKSNHASCRSVSKYDTRNDYQDRRHDR